MAKNFLGLFIITAVICAAGCSSPSSQELLIDSFEGNINDNVFSINVSRGSTVNIEPDRQNKVCGKQSLKVTYNLAPGGDMRLGRGYGLGVKGAQAWLVEPISVKWEDYDALSICIYGMGSGGVVALDICDSGYEYWRYLIKDDFTGWKEIICPFNDFLLRKDWQPKKVDINETLDTPILSFRLGPLTPGEGVYNFDCFKATQSRKSKNLKIALAGVSLSKPKEILFDSFEGEINKGTVDHSASEDSLVTVEADKMNKFCGEQSLKISYDLAPKDYMWIRRDYDKKDRNEGRYVEPQKVNWKEYNAISIQMYGSGTGSDVMFNIRDRGGEFWSYWLKDDFTGWRETVCRLSDFSVRKDWQPEGALVNGLIDFPIIGVEFEPCSEGKGSYNFDCFKAIEIKDDKKR